MHGAGVSECDICSICLDDGGVQVKVCPNSHYTHKTCFVQYILHHEGRKDMLCPECKENLSEYMYQNNVLFKPLFSKALKHKDPKLYKLRKEEEKEISREVKAREQRMEKIRKLKFFKSK